jgi:1-pyrroline-5-carboxylate dehydrogenase
MTATKITYGDLAVPGDDLHEGYENALKELRGKLGGAHPLTDPGARPGGTCEEKSPVDSRITVGHFETVAAEHVAEAVRTARTAQADWGSRHWTDRLDILEHAAELLSAEVFELAALLTYEIGKTRLEALGEAEEAAEFFRYYSNQWRINDGFDKALTSTSANEQTRSVLLPYGVWGVIAPFNFPLALAAGPAAAALAAGNTVVLKPSEQAYLSALRLRDTVVKAGVPADAFQVVPGPGETVGAALVAADIDGITFTGSYETGMRIVREIARGSRPMPVIVEMGGKNPAIVARSADVQVAADGIARSAFGFGGQKCSSCSRILVHRSLRDELVSALRDRMADVKVGDPGRRGTTYGPVIDDRALARYEAAVADTGDGLLSGGHRLTDDDLKWGVYVEPTLVEVPRGHRLWTDELFLPFAALTVFDEFSDALAEANNTPYGLTAGLFTRDQAEVDAFLDGIHAGVVYVNRPAGATTGAWPGMQPFGGWKGSGNGGRGGGGEHYAQQYAREQSRSIVIEGEL